MRNKIAGDQTRARARLGPGAGHSQNGPVPRVVVCLDKFRGSATAAQACTALADGLRRRSPALDVREIPMADGGEGTVDALVAAGWTPHAVTVPGPLGHPVEARFAARAGCAAIEMAQAAGRHLVGDAPDALRASTAGVGGLIEAALDLGCESMVLAVGGSATTDGGAGMLQALGARLLDAAARDLPPGGGALARLASVDLSGLDERLGHTRVTLAADVDNPLLGPRGAAAVFGPQKGASPDDVALLDHALARWANLVEPATRSARGKPGAGAAGGLGFAALAVLGARRLPGAEWLLDELGVDAALDGAAVVVVGEGRLDTQSLAGKAPVGVARAAARHGVPVVAVAGQVALDDAQLAAAGIGRSWALADRAADSMTRALPLLSEVGAELAAAVEAG